MASITDKITDVRNAARPNSARVSSSRSAGGTTLACDNLTGWPTASKVHFVTYQIDSNSNPVAGTQLDCSGIVSGNNIGTFTVIDGTDNGNNVGDVVEMLPTAAWGQDLADALTAQHSRVGAHVGVTNTGGMTTDTLIVTTGTTLPAGDIVTANLADDAATSAKMFGVDLFGVTSAIAGSVPTAGSGQFYLQSGTTTGTFGSNALDITFPTAFPNGVLSVLVCDGNSATGVGKSVTAANISKTVFRAQSPNNGSQTVNWIAIGF